eukprot:GFUD01116126.1.p1 GENE.GFUD01116126.1~~GFUD01116126.1.p1  ORF type:complete len:130 (-),score=7.78 GFUD01116126.1:85-450(-)
MYMYSVQCTGYNVQFTGYSVQWTVYSVQVQCTVYSAQCTVVQCTVYSLHLCPWPSDLPCCFPGMFLYSALSLASEDLFLHKCDLQIVWRSTDQSGDQSAPQCSCAVLCVKPWSGPVLVYFH